MSKWTLIVASLVMSFHLLADGAKPVNNWSGDWNVGNTDSVYATKAGNLIRIGNRFLERVYRVTHDTAATSQHINKLSKAPADVMQTTEFGLTLTGAIQGELTAADFKLTGISTQSNEQAMQVIFAYAARAHPELTARVIVETNTIGQPQSRRCTFSCWARRRRSLRSSQIQPFLID